MQNLRFLFCHRGALGDFIMLWSALSAIRDSFPGAEIAFIGRPQYLAYAKQKGLLDIFFDCESRDSSDFLSGNGRPDFPPGNYSHAFIWMKKDKALQDYMRSRLAAEIVFIEPFPDLHDTHISEYYYGKIADAFPSFPKTKKTFQIAAHDSEKKEENYFVIQPGSGSLKKNLPPGFYLSLAMKIREKHLIEPLFVLGPVEVERGALKEFSACRIATPSNLFELEDLLAPALFYVGNDSGATHFASVLGKKTFAIFTSASNPAQWSPIGPKTRILRFPRGKAQKSDIGIFQAELPLMHGISEPRQEFPPFIP